MLRFDTAISLLQWVYAMHLSDRTGLRLKLHDLHVLMTVVQAGSMSKAATHLNTTQPAVSRSIAVLERTIGVRLLERNSQGVEPTAYGRALLNGGVAAFDDLRQAVRNIEFLADPTAGEVRIGCTPLLAASFVSAVIDRLSRRNPRMVFHLVTGYVETLHRELGGRNVDLLIARRFGPTADERPGFEFLFDDSSVVAAGAQSPRSPAKGARAKRDHHPEDPHTQPRRAAFHRLRPRSRKDSGKAKINCAGSPIGPSRMSGRLPGMAAFEL